jgi:hypothetical protein
MYASDRSVHLYDHLFVSSLVCSLVPGRLEKKGEVRKWAVTGPVGPELEERWPGY